MVKQQPRLGKRRTVSAGAASDKGRPQRSVNPVPPASQRQWRAGLRSHCVAAQAEDSCATHLSAIEGTQEPGALLPHQHSAATTLAHHLQRNGAG